MGYDHDQNEETDAMAEDAAYENAFSMVPGMGEYAPMAAHTLEMLEDMNTSDDGPTPDAPDDTLERERALALQKGQAASQHSTESMRVPSAPRPSPMS